MKTPLKGYIYLRDNDWFREEQVYKMGIMTNGKSRDSTYSTGEVKRGTFVVVIEIAWCQMKRIDMVLKHHFQKLNKRFDGGTEFYSRSILKYLVPFVKSRLPCRVLSKEEVDKMERKQRDDVLRQNYLIQKVFKYIVKHKPPKVVSEPKDVSEPKVISVPKVVPKGLSEPMPNEQQQIVLNGIHVFYETRDIGKLIWACGLGKAMLGLFIVKELGFKRVLIGVPSIQLQEQMIEEIKKLFPRSLIQRVGGGSKYDPRLGDGFVVTTYHSCDTLLEEEFDFKIGDEAHHLVGISTDKGFRSFHRIRSKKTLFMTATEKVVENKENVLSMDQECFGSYIDTKSVCWAIEHKKITDYQVVLLKNTAEEVRHIMNVLQLEPDKTELFLSCLMTIKTMEKYPDLTHVLLYTNTTQDADLCDKYIDKIITNLSVTLFHRSLHSKSKDVAEDIETFKASPRGIISCVYLFGEGFDLPKLNGVCVAGHMQSDIRITQYLLRPNRLEKGNPDKIAYVLVPYLEEQWNTSSDKVTTLIHHLRNVDENVEHKIRVCSSGKPVPGSSVPKDEITEILSDFILKEDELSNIDVRLQLRSSKSLYDEDEPILSNKSDEGFITEAQLYSLKIINSKIEDCIVQNGTKILSTSKSYASVLRNVFAHIPIETILETTKFNMKKENLSENGYRYKGFRWWPELQLSVQYKDAKQTLEETIRMCKLNHFTFRISIRLESGNLICFKL
jgi:superfamily II DNA or RNA helicase